ncbi:MAG: hypothetical protein M5U34_08300 [Chloroflexi bacterium]|nr:hypothetical protein [Chloroflexota bacterium]
MPNIPNGRGDGRPGPPPGKGNSPSHRPYNVVPPFRLANETQNIRARRFVGAMQPGVILVQRRAASPAASPAPNIPNGRDNS